MQSYRYTIANARKLERKSTELISHGPVRMIGSKRQCSHDLDARIVQLDSPTLGLDGRELNLFAFVLGRINNDMGMWLNLSRYIHIAMGSNGATLGG